jgi:predicted phosphohydrolase
MSVYVIADLHLSLGSDKPMDVFRGWDNYVEKLKTNWDRCIREEDTLVIAGDISWAMKLSESYEDFRFIHQRPGKKLILKGNHDYWWSTRSKIEAFFQESGFDDIGIVHNTASVVDGIGICGTRGWMYNSVSEADKKIVNREVGRLRASIQDSLKKQADPVVFLHYPPVYDNFVCQEILEVLQEYSIKDCYFGHIHGTHAAQRALTGEYMGIKMHLISCDYINFCPSLVEGRNKF